MIIGVPREIKDHETRVGLVPSGVIALREAGHEVLAETHAGEGSSITDAEYAQAGATILDTAAELWRGARRVRLGRKLVPLVPRFHDRMERLGE